VEWTTTNVLCEDAVVGRIVKAAASPVGITVAVDAGLSPPRRPPTHGYESTREAAMAAFAKSWRRDTAEQAGYHGHTVLK
jgi:hypothetical protein